MVGVGLHLAVVDLAFQRGGHVQGAEARRVARGDDELFAGPLEPERGALAQPDVAQPAAAGEEERDVVVVFVVVGGRGIGGLGAAG